jgi:hypothetical protein
MSRLFSKADLQAFSALLTVVLLLTTADLPGVAVRVRAHSQPEFTINVCAPTQSLKCASNRTLARPLIPVPRFVLSFRGLLKATSSVEVFEHNEPPDTPPPKPFV